MRAERASSGRASTTAGVLLSARAAPSPRSGGAAAPSRPALRRTPRRRSARRSGRRVASRPAARGSCCRRARRRRARRTAERRWPDASATRLRATGETHCPARAATRPPRSRCSRCLRGRRPRLLSMAAGAIACGRSARPRGTAATARGASVWCSRTVAKCASRLLLSSANAADASSRAARTASRRSRASSETPGPRSPRSPAGLIVSIKLSSTSGSEVGVS